MPVNHSDQSGLSLHEDKRIKEPCRAASTANVSTSAPGASIDGVTLSSGDRILLKNQSTAAQNGIYVWAGASSALTRAADADTASDFVFGFLVYVRQGTVNAATHWVYTTQTDPINLGSTSLTFSPFGAGSGTVTSVALAVPAEFSVSGSPVTSSGTITVSKANESANTVFAGPTSGGAAAPTFRTLGSADIPVMVASGGSHASGAVPDPGASAGTAKFLREDASWVVPTGGGGGGGGGTGGSGALVPLAAIGPISAAQSTFSFAPPASGYRNLRFVIQARGDAAANFASVLMRFNTDSGSNYEYTRIAGSGSTASANTATAQSAALLGFVPAANALASSANVLNVLVPGYTDSSFKKSWTSQGGAIEGATVSGISYDAMTGQWESTTPISTIDLTLNTGNYAVGSYVCMYGEMDTAGALLTPASNLLYETTLTAATATIDTGTLSQSYRDLVIYVTARGDTAAANVNMQLQLNGDTGTNYGWARGLAGGSSLTVATNNTGQSSWRVAIIPAASAETGNAESFELRIPKYSQATFRKGFTQSGTANDGAASGNLQGEFFYGLWYNTAAINRLVFSLSAGNFLAGTSISIYGEPVSFGGSAYGTGTRLRISGNQSLTDATDTIVTWDTEDSDADNQHYTSSANLSGTVSKTAASQTLTGSSTSFTTELSIGQVISVPGTAAEKRVVTAIASNTSLTVNTAFVNTASGQTAARLNSPIVFRQPGFYNVDAGAYFASNATGFRKAALILNDTTVIAQNDQQNIGATAMAVQVSASQAFQQWDFIEVQVRQNSGGALNLTADQRTFFSVNSRPTVIVGVPYVNIQDQKAQNTSGGTFTSGSFQTRTLNTVVNDTASIASLSSNQVTLPVGTYRCCISAPANAVNRHQARLQNTTGAVTLLTGSSEFAGASQNAQTRSVIAGRFTLTAASALEVQHRCETTSGNTRGLGVEANFTTEVYAVAEFWKEG